MSEPTAEAIFSGRDDNPGAHAGQAELGEAQGQDDMRRPERLRRHEHDARERRAIGIVENERNAAGGGERGEARDLGVGQHVAGRVGRARGGDGADVLAAQRLFHGGEVNAVFEYPASRPSGQSMPGRQATKRSGSNPWSA